MAAEKSPVNTVFTMFMYAKCVQLRGSDVRIQTNATGRGQLECRETGDQSGRRDLSVHCRVRMAGERGAEGRTAKGRVGLAGIRAVAGG